ncbi:MAG TPA: cyclic nucleotide-binding domain-containing protein [Spirochaetota bacterium]|nr:cyclic nucleotide-binding domain-containing protein [Spirochaetota bacterium]
MNIEKLLLSFLPVVLFYLIYFRYFTSSSGSTKYISSFLTGMGYALFLLLAGGFISDLLTVINPLVKGFVMAGLLEKTGAVIIIYTLLKRYPEFDISRSIVSGMLVGLGFACVENFFYALELDSSILYIRMVFAVPLHITTCGIAGHYLGISKLTHFKYGKFINILKAILIPLLFHGVFDTVLMKGGVLSYISAPVLILSVVYLEVVLARAQSIFSEKKLAMLNMNMEEWRLHDRQPRYDRWVKRYTGILKSSPAPFFNWNPGITKFSFMVLMIIAAGAGMTLYRIIDEQYKLPLLREEAVAIFVLFPLCIALVLIISGAVNPAYFVKSLLSLPVISDVEIIKNGIVDEFLATNDLSYKNCFLQTTESLGLGKTVQLKFTLANLESKTVTGRVMWENHHLRHEAFGTIVRLEQTYAGFFRFIISYNLLRLWKGTVFLLRLPGFDAIKGLFYKPLIMTQEEEYFPQGEIVFREGEEGDKFYLIKKGRVIFYKYKDNNTIITVNTAAAGDFFGELAVLSDNKTRNATAMCAEDTILAIASRDNLDTLLANNPEFNIDLIETLTSRVVLSEKVFFESMREIDDLKNENAKLAHVSAMLVLVGLGFDSSKRGLDINIDSKKILRFIRHMDDLAAAQISSLFMKRQTILKHGGDPSTDQDFLESVTRIFSAVPDTDEEE